MTDLKKERDAILTAVADYWHQKEKNEIKKFQPGITPIPTAGKVLGSSEIQFATDAVLDGWLTADRFNRSFEERLANYLDVKFAITTVSGSSANLLAFTTLTSPKLKDKRIKPGDEVITVAAGFPTTVNPAVQNGLVPVFLDISLPTYNIDTSLLEEALTDKPRVIMVAHTLGNPFDLKTVTEFAAKHDLYLIEDTCDALGSTYDGKKVGTFGDAGTLSFYPAHHITMGDGGAIFLNNQKLKKILTSFRDWGRDCYCEPGLDNTCGRRFGWKMGELPAGYDHKYTYSHLGYNMKITEMQAAIALAQIDRIDAFVEARKSNHAYLKQRLQELEDLIILPEPTKNSDPSWFGFMISIRENKGGKRNDLAKHLNSKMIGTRLLFAGNLTKQPYFKDIKYRTIGNLQNTDFVMENSLWVGVYPVLTTDMLDYCCDEILRFFGRRTG